jgi:hypothetical protein
MVPAAASIKVSRARRLLTTTGSNAMSRHPPEAHDHLHLESASAGYTAERTDYPVVLLTRRTFAYSALEIARSREHAPSAVRGAALQGRMTRRPV